MRSGRKTAGAVSERPQSGQSGSVRCGKFKRAAKLAAVFFSCFVAAGALFVLRHAPSFAGAARYTLFLGETSSAEAIVLEGDALPLLLSPEVRGESAVYQSDCAEELLRAYRARVLFIEEAAGMVSYYCYSPLFGEGLLLNGKRVNLHIAAGRGQTAAGTPLLFGGF